MAIENAISNAAGAEFVQRCAERFRQNAITDRLQQVHGILGGLRELAGKDRDNFLVDHYTVTCMLEAMDTLLGQVLNFDAEINLEARRAAAAA